jgi:hypothetical protein
LGLTGAPDEARRGWGQASQGATKVRWTSWALFGSRAAVNASASRSPTQIFATGAESCQPLASSWGRVASRATPAGTAEALELQCYSFPMQKAKETVRTLLDRLPDDYTLADVLHHLSVAQAVEEGLADVRAGRTLAHAEVAARLRQRWHADRDR